MDAKKWLFWAFEKIDFFSKKTFIEITKNIMVGTGIEPALSDCKANALLIAP